MAYPSSFVRQTLLFNLLPGEVATTSFAWRPDEVVVSIDGLAAAAAARAVTFWDAMKGAFSIYTEFIGSRFQWYGLDGLIVETIEEVDPPVAGDGGSVSLPTEVAVVASLRTASAGRSGRGRMYLPPPSVDQVSTSGRLPAATGAGLAAALADLMQPISEGTTEWNAVVQSKTQQALRAITAVAVGDIFDAQRRRRDALIESYSVSAI